MLNQQWNHVHLSAERDYYNFLCAQRSVGAQPPVLKFLRYFAAMRGLLSCHS